MTDNGHGRSLYKIYGIPLKTFFYHEKRIPMPFLKYEWKCLKWQCRCKCIYFILQVEAELLEKLETEIEQLKLLTLKSCPNCGVRRPKRYHRSSQTIRSKPITTIITPRNRYIQEAYFNHQPTDTANFVTKSTQG